jgi:hypothetical protein
MNWFNNIIKQLERPVEENPIDKAIVEKLPQEGEVTKVYEARWVWYHSILAVELLITNILLILILFVLAFK